ncbi:diguanylate cyclase/phosphodiesterase domain protein [Burkholderia pseudomallei MSHR332]|nr:diguanylate cyclase/phosphodiesterase domain protein [Burkholderia pseudomallei MSHR332]
MRCDRCGVASIGKPGRSAWPRRKPRRETRTRRGGCRCAAKEGARIARPARWCTARCGVAERRRERRGCRWRAGNARSRRATTMNRNGPTQRRARAGGRGLSPARGDRVAGGVAFGGVRAPGRKRPAPGPKPQPNPQTPTSGKAAEPRARPRADARRVTVMPAPRSAAAPSPRTLPAARGGRAGTLGFHRTSASRAGRAASASRRLRRPRPSRASGRAR